MESSPPRCSKLIKACGIQHELTIPKTPEQNGGAERLNQTVMEMIRAMLLGAKLPQSLCAEAISTAAYLRNRSPTSTVEGMTPHQAWYDRKPGVDHLRLFGCTAYTYLPKDERGKLDSKTKKCTLLGYGSMQKGYRVFDHVTQIQQKHEVMSKRWEDLALRRRNLHSDSPGAELLPRRSVRERRPVDYKAFNKLTIVNPPHSRSYGQGKKVTEGQQSLGADDYTTLGKEGHWVQVGVQGEDQ